MTCPQVSLEFMLDGRVLFTSGGKWLYPLFELEEFLRGRGIDACRGEIRDKVVGRGSAGGNKRFCKIATR